MAGAAIVAIVDDDVSLQQSLPALIKQFGFETRAFLSAEDFLASDCVDQPKCLILDVSMPGMSGPDLQQELVRRGQRIPIVFITGQPDETLRRRLLADGAVECLSKPFNATALLNALNTAMKSTDPGSQTDALPAS
jgi:FixJ family two-component response regulator